MTNLTSDLKSLASGDPEHVARWHQICDEAATEEQQWIAKLRSIGIKAAHPDDAWVSRNAEHHDYVALRYPQFNDGVKVGDMIALGWPDRYRVRKVLAIHPPKWWIGTDKYQVIK